MQHPFSDIPEYPNWKSIIPIKKGWSSDQKFFIEDRQATTFLLRIQSLEQFEKERDLYRALNKVAQLDLPISKLLQSGYCENGKAYYHLFSWEKGIEARSILEDLDEQIQYDLGYTSGQVLRSIHQVKAPAKIRVWEPYFNWKVDRNLKSFDDCGVQFEKAGQVEKFLDENRALLKDRPQSYQHGDFHVGNMLIDQNRRIKIIDFNRHDFGDPWEEFNRMPWTAQESPAFANGIIHGYFPKQIPKLFFELMAYYIASNLIGSFAWAMNFGGNETKVMLELSQQVIDWYKGFETVIPNWYQEK